MHNDFICRIEKLQQLERVELLLSTLLTLHNYFERKPNILILLIRIGLYKITMATKVEPHSPKEKK
jgi:hypothetical protein